MVANLRMVCALVLVLLATLARPGICLRLHLHHPAEGAGSSSSEITHHRVRRQNGEVVESIFQVPIQTLMAVSKVLTTSIQSFNRQREAFYQATAANANRPASTASLYSRPPGQGAYSSAYSSAYASLSSRPRPRAQSSAASVAGVGVQADGSSYRI